MCYIKNLNDYWWYWRVPVLCYSLKSTLYHFSLANYLVHMMLLGARFKLNLKLSACENLIKTDLMTGKLLKDPKVSREEEDNTALSEVSTQARPRPPICGTPTHPPSGKGAVSGSAGGQALRLLCEWRPDH